MTGANLPAGCVDGVLAGRYRLLELIAVGGMGEVWRGEDTVLGRLVAVKCLKPEYVHDPEFSDRFRAEARHAAGLSHPGIASVYDYGEQAAPADRAAWLVMELVDGEPLSTMLHRSGALPPEQALDIVGQAAMALEAAHAAGVVHRDVKPGNLLVRPDGVVKVTDFGIARATDAVPTTRTGTVVGTAYYLSPEQASGGHVTPASDVYSLGVVAYECLAGRRPFVGDNPIAVASAHLSQSPPPLPLDLPEAVRDLVFSALEKDPALRPAHAGELGRTAMSLRAELAGGSQGTTVLPVEPPAAARPADPPTRALTTAAPGVASAAVSGPAAVPVPATGRRLPPVPPSSRSSHRRALRLASVLLAVVVLGLSLRACGGDERTQVPTVAAGVTVAAATDVLEAADLTVEQRTTPSRTVGAGKVIGTDPPAGTPIASGGEVTLLVSAGPPKVDVRESDYVGKSAAAVRDALIRLGLKPTYAYDGRDRPAGTVSSVTPTGPLTVGSPVTVHVVPQPEERDDGDDKGRGKGKDRDDKDD